MARTDETLDALIRAARDVSVPVATRHRAFEELVRRFQDLALACARARLRDPALAEDAAQDAFLVAWERLAQLRETAAFPGWLRRLVLTQCHRRLRARRLDLQPASESEAVPAQTDPGADAEAADAAALVRVALTELGPADRLALILFYGSGHTHAEIAEWLGVPVTTISRRLAHAKRRMRGHLHRALSGGLRLQRTIAGEAFIVELSARLRSADISDDQAIGSLACRLGVGLGATPRLAPGARRHAYVVEDPASRMPFAYAAAAQTIFHPIYDLQLVMGEDALRRHAADVLLTQIVQDVVASDAIALQHRISTRHAVMIKFLTARGFQIVARGRDTLVLERLLRKTVEVAPRVLDEYVGRYVSEMPAGPTFVIARHGASLISTTRDMRDLLLAASETEFFTRHHYGRGRFERDERGLVTRLVCTEGAREFVAIRE